MTFDRTHEVRRSPNYGVRETNNLYDVMSQDEIAAYRGAPTIDIKDPRLIRVTRLRYVSDPGFPAWDLSYCWGIYNSCSANADDDVVVHETGVYGSPVIRINGWVNGIAPCRVRADFLHQLPKFTRSSTTGQPIRLALKSALYNVCKANGIHAKNLGIFDALSTLI